MLLPVGPVTAAASRTRSGACHQNHTLLLINCFASFFHSLCISLLTASSFLLFPSTSSTITNVEFSKNISKQNSKHSVNRFSARSRPFPHSFSSSGRLSASLFLLKPHQPALLSSSAAQSESVEDLIAFSQKKLAITKTPKEAAPMQSQNASAQKPNIKINHREAMRRCSECLQ